MPANNDPIYTRTPDIQIGGTDVGIVANTATVGTSAANNMWLIFTADATEGGFVQKVILKAQGTVAATVARIFLCNVTSALTIGTTNTAANTMLIAEATLAAFTASNTTASPQIEIPLNIPMPASFKLLIAFGTATGATGNAYATTVIGGKY